MYVFLTFFFILRNFPSLLGFIYFDYFIYKPVLRVFRLYLSNFSRLPIYNNELSCRFRLMWAPQVEHSVTVIVKAADQTTVTCTLTQPQRNHNADISEAYVRQGCTTLQKQLKSIRGLPHSFPFQIPETNYNSLYSSLYTLRLRNQFQSPLFSV